MNQSSNFNAVENRKPFHFISYLLVFLMLACCVLVIDILIQNNLPGWSPDIIAGITVFVVLDRLYTYQRIKRLRPFSQNWALTLGAQWAVIALVIKILLTYRSGFDAFVTDISFFNRGELTHLFNLEFGVTLLLALLVWSIAGQFLTLLDEIGLDNKVALVEEATPSQSEPLTPHQRLTSLTFQLGIALVLLTALTRLNLTSLYNPNGTAKGLTSASGAEAGALFYFIFGFALLSLTRLMSLQTGWRKQHIAVASDNMVRQWGAYSILFLLILVLVVGFLSSGNNLGLFSLLGILFEFLTRIVIFIGQLIWSLLYFISILPLLLFGKGVPATNELPAVPTPTPPPSDPVAELTAPVSNPILTLIRSMLLWGSLILLIVFSVVRFVRQHGGLQGTLRKLPIASWLFFAWQWISKHADNARRALSRTIADAWQRMTSPSDGKRLFPRPNLIRLSTLDPRRQIYFFYLAMIRRGTEQGLERKPAQTPAEYAATLGSALPDANEDVRSLTNAFVEARYSSNPVDAKQANFVKALWQRIRRTLHP